MRRLRLLLFLLLAVACAVAVPARAQGTRIKDLPLTTTIPTDGRIALDASTFTALRGVSIAQLATNLGAAKLNTTNGVAVGLTTATVPSTGNSVANKTYVDALGLNQSWVNVKNAPYNAVGNGMADDTAALKLAVESGKHVFLPSGNFLISASLTNAALSKIRGNGRDNTRITATTTNVVLVFNGTLNGGDINTSFELSDIAIYAKNAVRINTTATNNWDDQQRVVGVVFKHCDFWGTYNPEDDADHGTTNAPAHSFLLGQGVGLQATKLYDSHFQNCRWRNFGLATYLEACDINVFDANRWVANARHFYTTHIGSEGSQTTIQNSDILLNYRRGGIYLNGTHWDTIENNYFETNFDSSEYINLEKAEGTVISDNRFDASVGTIPIISINAEGAGVILTGNRGGNNRTIEILHNFWTGTSAQQTLVQFADNLSTFPETLSPQCSYTKRTSSRVWGPYSPKRLLGNAATNWPWGTTSGGLPGISTITSGNLIVQMATESTDDSLEVSITAEASGGYVNVKWGGTNVWLADWSTSTNLQTVTRQIVRPSGVLPDSGLVFEFAAGQGYICGIQLTPSPQNIQGSTLTISTNAALSGNVAVQAAAASSAATHFPVFTATPASAATTIKMRTAAEVRSDIGAGTGSGTVTSVAASVPSFLSIAGSPITTSGTLAVSYSGTALPVANGGTGLTALGTGVTTALAAASTGTLGIVRSDSPDITGSMSVDGATFKVDGVNNRVGVNIATPAYTLDVGGRISYNTTIGEGADVTLSSSGTTIIHALSAAWVAQQFFAGGTNAMTVQKSGTTIFGPLSTPAGHTSPTYTSTVAIGTAPLTVTSTTKVTNLNADTVDGLDSTAFQPISATLTAVAAGTAQTLASTIISVTENTQTGTTYTVLSTDNGKVVTLNNAAAITVTVPTLSAGFTCTFIQKGAGQVTFSASGTTVSNAHSQTKTFGQYAAVTLYGLSSTTFVLAGDTGT